MSALLCECDWYPGVRTVARAALREARGDSLSRARRALEVFFAQTAAGRDESQAEWFC
jgi:hypothetical protein